MNLLRFIQFLFFFFCRFLRSSNSYPYPRTHSLVVVPSTRPLNDDNDNISYLPLKSRPPLNRAIPTIPESRSNDSIMTETSERRDDHSIGIQAKTNNKFNKLPTNNVGIFKELGLEIIF